MEVTVKELADQEDFCYTTGMDRRTVARTTPSRIEWLTDLVRLEIALWERVDRRLRDEHDLSLAFFEVLYFVGSSRECGLRVGDLARALRVTVGGTSKLVDRIEVAGLIRRAPDVEDRRASRLVLTDAGRLKLAATSDAVEAEMASVLDTTLSSAEQHCLHGLVTGLVTRLLAAADDSGAS